MHLSEKILYSFHHVFQSHLCLKIDQDINNFTEVQRRVSFLLFLCKSLHKASISGLGVEKAMATHSSTLAWKIPWMEEPGRLQSMVSHRVGHD